MNAPIPSDVHTELLERVAAYDRCWTEQRPEDIRRFLHPDVVFCGRHCQRFTRGIDASVRSYLDFLASARIHSFRPSDYVTDLVGRTAIMTYRWKIDYETAGQRCVETGHDLLVWVREGIEWLIVWRHQCPDS